MSSVRAPKQISRCHTISTIVQHTWRHAHFKVRYVHRVLQCNDCTYSRPWPATDALLRPSCSSTCVLFHVLHCMMAPIFIEERLQCGEDYLSIKGLQHC